MIWFILGWIVFVIVLVNIVRDASDVAEMLMLGIIGLIMGAVVAMVPIGIGMIIGSNSKIVIEQNHDFPLVSLKVKDGFSGSFYLASGSIQGDEYYFWYARNPDGSIVGGRTHRDIGVNIYEGDYQPMMRTYKSKYASDFTRNYGWIYGIDVRSTINWTPTFFVPAGSVDTSIKVN